MKEDKTLKLALFSLQKFIKVMVPVVISYVMLMQLNRKNRSLKNF